MNAEVAKKIQPINTDTTHKICSGQVVLNLANAVKELVENSLDAGATNVDIRFKNYGIELIEVSDNGTGVTEDNFAALTLKYHTSKLREYSDLLGVSSFGFRGEALSSLCALSNLTITTRHQTAKYATKIEYDQKGNIITKSPCSRQVGTTVSLRNLFFSLPVRQKEFHKNVKREFNKMTNLLYAYCLISLGVKITCTNQTSTNSKSVVVATNGSMAYKDNIACVFGIKQLQNILEVNPDYGSNIKENIFKGLSGDFIEVEDEAIEDVEIDLSEDSNDTDTKDSQNPVNSSQPSQGYKNVVKPIEFTGYISTCAHGCGRSSSDRQFYYINSRPCEPTKIMKVINEVYKQYNPNQYPFVFINMNLERMSVDVNVTPDKRKIFLTKEKIILNILKNSLLKLFETIPRTLKIENTMSSFNSNDPKADTDQPKIFHSFLQKFSNKLNNENNSSTDNNITEKPELKRKSTSVLDFVKAKTLKQSYSITNLLSCDDRVELDVKKIDNVKENYNDQELEHYSENVSYSKSSKIESSVNDGDIMYLEYSDKLPDTQIKNVDDVLKQQAHTIYCKTKSASICKASGTKKKSNKVITDTEDLGKHNRKSVTLKTSISHVKQLVDMYQSNKRKLIPERVKFKSTINPVHNKKCEEELSKEISRDSFNKMVIVGQFNLGFIITRLDDDLFIIDQHATDEIYNFEMLQKNTELTTQKLVVPQCLELTGVNEQILMDNLDVFKKNGFTFKIDEDAPPTKRVHLLSKPMSKNWLFGKEDIEELLFMLRESSSEYCRPSRVRSMFASRACRKSVMIGTALSKADMKNLVIHMSEIDKPWNCPHGRPTIRHLVNLAMVHTKDERQEDKK